MNNCKDCQHFRPYRPISQLIARELTVNDSQLASQIISIMQDEIRLKETEAKTRVDLFKISKMEWDKKPRMTDFCGFENENNTYLVYEIKNNNHTCKDYTPKTNAKTECESCSFCRKPDGPQKDNYLFQQMQQISIDNTALGQGGGDGGMMNLIQRIGAVKSFEAAQVYYMGKFIFSKPNYFSICAHYSTDTDFIPCILQNTHFLCNTGKGKAKDSDSSKSNVSNFSLADGLKKIQH